MEPNSISPIMVGAQNMVSKMPQITVHFTSIRSCTSHPSTPLWNLNCLSKPSIKQPGDNGNLEFWWRGPESLNFQGTYASVHHVGLSMTIRPIGNTCMFIANYTTEVQQLDSSSTGETQQSKSFSLWILFTVLTMVGWATIYDVSLILLIPLVFGSIWNIKKRLEEFGQIDSSKAFCKKWAAIVSTFHKTTKIISLKASGALGKYWKNKALCIY